MVAISLYRGNLHKVSSNVPRQWLMPPPKISLKDFKILLRRRHRALFRIAATNRDPNSDDLHNNQHKDEIFEEIGKIGGEGRELEELEFVGKGKDGIFEEIGKIDDKGRELEGVKLVGKGKDGILEEIGKIDDEGRELEVVKLVGEGKDGILEGIGKNDFEGRGLEVVKLGKESEDGILEEIGKIDDEGRELEVVKLVGEGKDGILEGIGKDGCEGKGLEASKLVEEAKVSNDFEGKALEVLKLVEEEVEKEKGDGKDEMENGGGVKKLVEGTESLVVEGKHGEIKEGDEGNAGCVRNKENGLDCDNGLRIDQQVETNVEGVDVANPSLEIARKEEDVSDKHKRRQEIEEKLKVLNEKKHSLVQALKQILNLEAELKRRSDIQGFAGQPPVGGGQVVGTHDSGSMSRLNTPRMGSEGNVSGRRTFDATPLSRNNSGMANSPSRFALAGHQGLPPHFPSVSVSGTNYITSSPSPAASGGTSAFRDGRGPSPWN